MSIQYKTPLSILKGFSLVELLLTLGIISTLFGLGYANYRGYQRKQAVMAVARQIEGDIRLAQEYASQGKKPSGCTLLDGYLFQINTTPANTYDILADCPTNVVVKNDVGVSGMTITPTGSIQFKVLGEGTNLASDRVITVTSPNTGIVVAITVSRGGTVSMDFQ
jgi:prepilin-type N-terminal cleavage/methylation domain-containing protein